MSIFKHSLRNRIRSLESYFGLFYAKDSYGDLEHKLEADGYSVLHNLQKDVKAIQEQLKGKQ
jgi:hypothetical protein